MQVTIFLFLCWLCPKEEEEEEKSTLLEHKHFKGRARKGTLLSGNDFIPKGSGVQSRTFDTTCRFSDGVLMVVMTVEDEEDSWRRRRTSPRSLACSNWEGKGVFEVGARADLLYLSLLQTPTLSPDVLQEREIDEERKEIKTKKYTE